MADNHRPTHRAGIFDTPCGPMIAVVRGDGALVRLDFFDGRDAEAAGNPTDGADFIWRGGRVRRDDGAVAAVALQLGEYYAGTRRTFDLVLAPEGNAFLQRAWQALRQVRYGETVSYGELARRVDPPTSARAMGRANAVNPISVVVPCHRVIGADGRLTGYGGGLPRKARLLALEGALPAQGQGELPLSPTAAADPRS